MPESAPERDHVVRERTEEADPHGPPAPAVRCRTGGQPNSPARSEPSARQLIDVRLLPKDRAPEQFRLLRPITILPSGMNIESRIMLQLVGEFDNGGTHRAAPEPNMLGFRRAHQCSELMACLRNVV